MNTFILCFAIFMIVFSIILICCLIYHITDIMKHRMVEYNFDRYQSGSYVNSLTTDNLEVINNIKGEYF